MKAKIGDVYTIYNNRLRLYTACQITNVIEDKGDAICLYLDWTGESPLHLVQMENLQPLYMDFMYWERQLCIANVDIDVPAYFNLQCFVFLLTALASIMIAPLIPAMPYRQYACLPSSFFIRTFCKLSLIVLYNLPSSMVSRTNAPS